MAVIKNQGQDGCFNFFPADTCQLKWGRRREQRWPPPTSFPVKDLSRSLDSCPTRALSSRRANRPLSRGDWRRVSVCCQQCPGWTIYLYLSPETQVLPATRTQWSRAFLYCCHKKWVSTIKQTSKKKKSKALDTCRSSLPRDTGTLEYSGSLDVCFIRSLPLRPQLWG